MALTSLASLEAALAASPPKRVYKTTPTPAAGRIVTCFAQAGLPAAGSVPGTAGRQCVSTDAGAIAFANPTGGLLTYLGRAELLSTQVGTLLIYDRLVDNGGFSTNVATAQAMTTPAITRPDANGAGVELWAHLYTVGGATASTLTASYTNQDGVAGKTATISSRAWNTIAGEMVRFDLAAGDTGVRSVQSITFGTATGTAGSVGIVLMRKVAAVPIALANVVKVSDGLELGLPQITDNAHLSMLWVGTGTTAPVLQGDVHLVQS